MEERHICDECGGLCLYELEIVETDMEETKVCDDCLESKYITDPRKTLGQQVSDLQKSQD